jgi:DNA-binding LytR/AlgR family response regulator
VTLCYNYGGGGKERQQVNIIICDDKNEDMNILRAHIHKFFSGINCAVHIAAYENGDRFLRDFETKKTGDLKIAFLDIYMPGTDGVNVARKIRQTDEDLIIIFTTTSINHGLEGYSVNAFQYLVKPIHYPEVEKILGRCMARFADSLRFIEVLSDRLSIKIYLKDITYIEVFNTTLLIHTVSETIKSYLPISEMEKQLEGGTFLRTHRSFIVNMRYIHDIAENDFLLTSGASVPIRKNDRLTVRQAFRDYLFEQSRGM